MDRSSNGKRQPCRDSDFLGGNSLGSKACQAQAPAPHHCFLDELNTLVELNKLDELCKLSELALSLLLFEYELDELDELDC